MSTSTSVPSSSVTRTALRQNRIEVVPPKGIEPVPADHPQLSFDQVPQLIESLKPRFSYKLQLQAVGLSGRQLPTLTKDEAVLQFFFSAHGVRHVQPHPNRDPSHRCVVVNVPTAAPLPKELQQVVEKNGFDVFPYEVELGWEHLSSDQILEALLPAAIVEKEGVPTGFTIVGHIAHLNLLEIYLPYRFLVGAIILDKNKTALRTVVNKLDTIDTEFRFFKMELLAGEPDFVARVSESECSFSFDFRTVYWNSRLHAEHMRLIKAFRPNQVVADVMAGVGPFAVPAAKRSAWVIANDLNPASYSSLVANARHNKVLSAVPQAQAAAPLDAASSAAGSSSSPQLPTDIKPDDIQSGKFNTNFDGGVVAYCQDGREFVYTAVREAWNRAFRGRPRSVCAGAKSAEECDEQIREFGRKTVKTRSKAVRHLHAAKHEARLNGTAVEAGTKTRGEGSSHIDSAAPENPQSLENKVADLGINTSRSARENVARFEARRLVDHFVMNLPATAIEFLDAYRGVYTRLSGEVGRESIEREIQRRCELRSGIAGSSRSPSPSPSQSRSERKQRADGKEGEEGEEGEGGREELDDSQEIYPMVHVHCFSKEPFRPARDIVGRANRALGIQEGATYALRAAPITPPAQSLALTRRTNTNTNSNTNINTNSNSPLTATDSGAEPPSLYLSKHPDYDTFSSFRSPEQMTDFLDKEWADSGTTPSKDLSIHYVRDVAPNKQMYCLSFRLPPEVLWAPYPPTAST
ncbi:hypothetical protein BCV70DRAFT_196961 [Testicularia cyperi]|uniref:tRNA (guanine(37)-N1)-methyltransferase n=1 Tax=Testicularia cyperi TaxID=1882483 RepID=A0A317XY73_9BASI|nr:hypothetical protein BCV70DRAFT_196961 [Testicularia cyperi]